MRICDRCKKEVKNYLRDLHIHFIGGSDYDLKLEVCRKCEKCLALKLTELALNETRS